MRSLPPLSKKHKAVVAAGGVVLVLLVLSAVFGSRGLIHLRRLHGRQAELELLASRMESKNESVRDHLRRLETDDGYLEKTVRERLGWVRPNEMLYRVNPEADGFQARR